MFWPSCFETDSASGEWPATDCFGHAARAGASAIELQDGGRGPEMRGSLHAVGGSGLQDLLHVLPALQAVYDLCAWRHALLRCQSVNEPEGLRCPVHERRKSGCLINQQHAMMHVPAANPPARPVAL